MHQPKLILSTVLQAAVHLSICAAFLFLAASP